MSREDRQKAKEKTRVEKAKQAQIDLVKGKKGDTGPVPKTSEQAVVKPILTEGPPRLFWRHDLLVLLGAAALLAAGWVATSGMTRPRTETFSAHGLTLSVPKRWLPSGDAAALPAHLFWQSFEDPLLRLEVKVDTRPALSGPPQATLDLARAHTYGELYEKLDRDKVVVNQQEWIRTRFAYAFKPTPDDAPAVATGIEYALVNGDKLYVVTAHGSEARVVEMENDILRTVEVK